MEMWEIGDIARVIETIPGDGFPRSFCYLETFEVEDISISEDGDLMLVGGRFHFPIKAKRCEKVLTNYNPWPRCAKDELFYGAVTT